MKEPLLLNPESLPPSPLLLIPSRLNAEEFLYLKELIGNRPLTLLSEKSATIDPELFSITKGSEIYPVEDTLLDLASLLGENGMALFLPSPVSTLKGQPLEIQPETQKTLCQSAVSVFPLAVHRISDSKLLVDSATSEPSSIMKIGDPLASDNKTSADLLQNILIAAEACFSSREFLNGSLSTSLFTALHRHSADHYIHDGLDDSRLSFNRVHAASLALADYIKSQSSNKRIGIILPPGKGGIIANLAVLFAGKVPVNLNFTAGKKSVESALKQANLDYFITAEKFMEKLPQFAWPKSNQLLLLDTLTKKLKPKALSWMLKLKLSSTAGLIKKLGLNQSLNNEEAVLLFTSGSSGAPKGVSLSHRNLLANICQFSSRLNCAPGSNLLACLPLFHSFGSTVTTLFPLLEGHNIITYPNPLETKRLAELIDTHNVSFLTSTPTFLRGYLRNAKPEQLAKLRFVITAAEKLPKNLAQTFEKKLGHLPLEGYGLTETSPAAYINLPNLETVGNKSILPSAKFGTVGLPLVGVAIRITDPITGEKLPISSSGCIWLKGANIFQGYLNRPDLTSEVIKDGWFNTGDIGHIDEDGFLTLDGRLSRFSKIAGEMVPHETVEAETSIILGLDEEEERKIAIVGVPDEKKGEALILLSSVTDHQKGNFINDLKQELIKADIPALWCPKAIISVESIPILASGKLDLAGCRALIN